MLASTYNIPACFCTALTNHLRAAESCRAHSRHRHIARRTASSRVKDSGRAGSGNAARVHVQRPRSLRQTARGRRGTDPGTPPVCRRANPDRARRSSLRVQFAAHRRQRWSWLNRKALGRPVAEPISDFLGVKAASLAAGAPKLRGINRIVFTTCRRSPTDDRRHAYLPVTGLIIADECHHVPAARGRTTRSADPARRWLFGLTATAVPVATSATT